MSRISRFHLHFHPIPSFELPKFELPKGFSMDTETQHFLEGALVWLAALPLPPSPPFLYFYFTFSIVVLKITGSLKKKKKEKNNNNKMFKLY